MKKDAVYIELLIDRLKYFRDKKISELTDEEIKEYMNLRQEVMEVFPEVKETVTKVWEVVKEYADLYQERVLNK